MNWDFFNGFWFGALSMVLVLISLVWSVDEREGEDDDGDDDDYHYEPIA